MPHLETRILQETNRRDMLKAAAGLGAVAALGASNLVAASPAAAQAAAPAAAVSDVITRAFPTASRALPVIGLGTFLTFDVIPGQKRDHLREVVRRFWEAGGRVIDTSPLYGTGEITVGDAAVALGINQDAFIADKIWSTGEFLADDSHALRSLEQSLGRLWREKIDLMQVHSLVNVDAVLPVMRAWKKEGRIRFIGVTHHQNPYYPLLVDQIRRGGLDFVQVSYSISNRASEQTVLKAAAERGVGVLINMPFEKARLHKIVGDRPLPDFAADIGATSWSAFFLKWVLAHPAVTCALPSTSNPDHLTENMQALRGPLPDEAMRARMVRHMETIPGFDKLAEMAHYPDKRYPGIIGRAQAEIRARS